MNMKKPFASPEKLREIAATYGTPCHIYDEAGFIHNIRRLRQAFSWNPGYKEFFAVKATPNPYLLQLLRQEKAGTDCSSLTELIMSDRCGFKQEEIMFSSNDTPDEDFKLALKLKATINLDDISHLDEVLRLNGGQTLPEKMSCRFNPGGVFEVANGIMDNPGDAKYGMTREQIKQAYAAMRRLGVRRFGIHAFLVSNSTSNAYYPKLARLLFELAVEIKQELGIELSFVNLSGGIGIPYKPEQAACDIEAIGAAVRAAYESVLVPAGLGTLSIYTELGRYIMGPYGGLLTRVQHIKDTYKQYVGVDACAADLMRPAMYGAYHHITVVGKETWPADHRYDVTGGLCENNDKFAVDRRLPQIEPGDLLFIHDTGAHGFSMGYNYNGKLRHQELLLQPEGSVRRIRRNETPRDYFATLDFSGLFNDLSEYGC